MDRKKIEEVLLYIEGQIRLFEENKEWNSKIEKAALERIAHMTIDGILDVGNSMIDGFIMRDPGSYDDIIDILEDEKVITKEMSESFKRMIPLRKKLLQSYTNVDHQELQERYSNELPMFKQFSVNVREYIENELGPVTAFIPS